MLASGSLRVPYSEVGKADVLFHTSIRPRAVT